MKSCSDEMRPVEVASKKTDLASSMSTTSHAALSVVAHHDVQMVTCSMSSWSTSGRTPLSRTTGLASAGAGSTGSDKASTTVTADWPVGLLVISDFDNKSRVPPARSASPRTSFALFPQGVR